MSISEEIKQARTRVELFNESKLQEIYFVAAILTGFFAWLLTNGYFLLTVGLICLMQTALRREFGRIGLLTGCITVAELVDDLSTDRKPIKILEVDPSYCMPIFDYIVKANPEAGLVFQEWPDNKVHCNPAITPDALIKLILKEIKCSINATNKFF